MFKLHKGPTNYFHLLLVLIGGLTAASLLYISYLLTIVSFDEAGIDNVFLKPRHVAMSVSTNRAQYAIGDQVKVSVQLDIQGRKTPGVDVVLAYDPTYLEPVSLVPAVQATSPKDKKAAVTSITKGIVRFTPQTYLESSSSRFDTLPYFSIDYDKAQIRFSALMQPLNDFEGKGEIASLYFKAIRPGMTEIKIISDQNSTTDSNVAFGGRDILNSTTNTTINIR